MKEFIKSELKKYIIKEDSSKDKKDEAKLNSKYKRIEAILSNDIFNHSAIIRRLWGDDDATNRSLFRKKLYRLENENGSPYEFTDEELSKISNILMDVSSQIRKKVGKSGKG